MPIYKLNNCQEFIAGDNTILREIIHADKGNFALNYSLAHARLEPGKTSYPHSLKTSEVYYIISGQGEMHIDEEITIVEPTDTVYIPPHAKQFIKNIGEEDLIFVCIVEPAWKEEDEAIYN